LATCIDFSLVRSTFQAWPSVENQLPPFCQTSAASQAGNWYSKLAMYPPWALICLAAS